MLFLLALTTLFAAASGKIVLHRDPETGDYTHGPHNEPRVLQADKVRRRDGAVFFSGLLTFPPPPLPRLPCPLCRVHAHSRSAR